MPDKEHAIEITVKDPLSTFNKVRTLIHDNSGKVNGERLKGTFSAVSRWGTVEGTYQLLDDLHTYKIVITSVPMLISYDTALGKIKEYFQDHPEKAPETK